jgi:arginine-tRNA-protein transferase
MEAEPETVHDFFDDSARILQCKGKPELINLNQIYQNDTPSHCGYCNKDDTSYSWSFTSKKIPILEDKMEPYTYQLLMERGWRRCGTYYYKPNLQKSCCKLFTHRLEVQKYKPKKDQKKALKKVIAIAYEKIEEMKDEERPKGK